MKQARIFSRLLQRAEGEALNGDTLLLDAMHAQIGEVLRECPQIVDWVCANKMSRVLRTQHEVNTILSNRK